MGLGLRLSVGLDDGFHILRMGFNGHFGDDVNQRSLGVNNKRCSGNAHIGFSIHALFPPCAVSGAQSPVLIHQQRKGQIVFLNEFFVLGGIITTGA